MESKERRRECRHQEKGGKETGQESHDAPGLHPRRYAEMVYQHLSLDKRKWVSGIFCKTKETVRKGGSQFYPKTEDEKNMQQPGLQLGANLSSTERVVASTGQRRGKAML